VIENYDDLYATVQSAIDAYLKQNEAAEIVFQKNDNNTCEIKNKQNSKKLVLMFARMSDEYKVGFAFYEPDAYGGFSNPEWIDDIGHGEFDEKFAVTLIDEHLVNSTPSKDW
jgi:hypothetical protein